MNGDGSPGIGEEEPPLTPEEKCPVCGWLAFGRSMEEHRKPDGQCDQWQAEEREAREIALEVAHIEALREDAKRERFKEFLEGKRGKPDAEKDGI